MSKDQLKSILQLACSKREWEYIKYAVYKQSALSTTGARRHNGLKKWIYNQKRWILLLNREKDLWCYKWYASVQEKALPQSCGMVSDSDSDSFSSDSDCQLDSVADHLVKEAEIKVSSINDAVKVLEECNFNWFTFHSISMKLTANLCRLCILCV